jgi:hypothetical protein
LSRCAGTKPASRISRQISASFRQCVVPALDTTFSSIITLPMSLAPWRRPACPTSGPMVTQLEPIDHTLSRCRRLSACVRR